MLDLTNFVKNADEAFAISWYKDIENGELVYTDIGEKIYKLKYGCYRENYETCTELKAIIETLKVHTENIDLILPVPSYLNQERKTTFMYKVAEELGLVTKVKVDCFSLKKLTIQEAKLGNLSVHDFAAEYLGPTVKKILLVDDLFGRGNTANFVIQQIRSKNPDVFIRFISLTRNKYGGIPKNVSCQLHSNKIHKAKNGSEYIILYFELNIGEREYVNVFPTSAIFDNIKKDLENNVFNKIYDITVKRNNDFWKIVY